MDAPAGFDSNGVWFYDHNGVLIEVKVAEKSSPDEKSDFSMTSQPPGTAAAPMRSKAARVRAAPPCPCARLHRRRAEGDRVLQPRARPAAVRSLGRRHLLHARHPWQRPPPDRLRQVERAGPAPLQLGCRQRSTRSAAAPCRWPTRASAKAGASAAMCSARTTSTMSAIRGAAISEYSADIDYIPLTTTGRPGDYPPEDSIYLWGPEMPKDFVVNMESEA